MIRICFLVDGEGVYVWVDLIIIDRNEKVVLIFNLNSVSVFCGLVFIMYNFVLINEVMLFLVVYYVFLLQVWSYYQRS